MNTTRNGNTAANVSKRWWSGGIGLVSVLAVLGLGPGCATAAAEPERRDAAGQASPTPSSTRSVNSGASPAAGTVAAVRAIRIATAAVKGGRVFDIELDRKRGRPVWELDIASGGRAYEVTIDARSGKIVRTKRDRTPDRDMRLLAGAKVNAVGAAKTATRAVRRAKLQGVELTRWRGRTVWKSDLVTTTRVEYDVIIDARTGKLLSKQIDD